MMSLLLALTLVQDTVSDYKLERHLPKNWDAFVEIDGVEKFVADYNASKTSGLVKDALAAVKEQGGPDVLGLFEHNLGVTPEDLAGLIKGQLAAGFQFQLRGGASVIITADCRSAENAKKLVDLIANRLPNAKEIDVDDLKGMGSKEGPTVVAAGPVVYMGNTWATVKELVGKRAVDASKPIADEDVFTKARTASGGSRPIRGTSSKCS